jgi:tetratricopeptide (TPR) repeat protein
MHVFVAMPYGTKEGIDFNKVYTDLIKPALTEAGFEVFRSDEEQRAGEIRTEMFQELLLADLVIADISIDNPNVWYELGVRHGLRSRGVIQIKCARDYMPFDVYTDRTLTYHIKEGVPDLHFLDNDKESLRTMVRKTLSSWIDLKISPVFNLLPYLEEPNWKSLRVRNTVEFWEKQMAWQSTVEIARKKQRPGDILILADEAPIQALRLEAYRTATKALLDLGQFSLALKQIEKAIFINPKDLESLRLKGILLGRLENYEAAKELIRSTISEISRDSETLSILGRLQKDQWIQAWRGHNKTPEQMTNDAISEISILEEAIDTYYKAFMKDPSHYYSGINAISLSYLHQHLAGDNTYTEKIKVLEGGIRWALLCALSKEDETFKDYWARVSLGDLEILMSDRVISEKAYKHAIAVADNNWFDLDSSRQQLLVLRDLGFRPVDVVTAISIFDQALTKVETSEIRSERKQAFLFSGLMIDQPGKNQQRFPNDPTYIDIATKAIAAKVDELGANKGDIALCGGACGGDLLFAEVCLARGLHLEIKIPFDEPTFIEKSVSFAGDQWVERFYNAKDNPNTNVYIMPNEIGTGAENANVYIRNNIWLLYTALSYNSDKAHFICLWDRKEGGGVGGTKHIYDLALNHFGAVHVLNTNELFWHKIQQ